MGSVMAEEVSVLEADSTGRNDDVEMEDEDDTREPVTAVLNLILSHTPIPPTMNHIHLRGNLITFGRAVTNNIIMDSLQISRHHASLEYKEDRWFIRDMSTNGILINHKKYPKNDWAILQDMDTIQFIPTGALQYRIRYAYRTTMPPELLENGRLREVKTLHRPRGPSRSPIQIDLADGGESDADSNASVSLLCGSGHEEMFEALNNEAGQVIVGSGKKRLAESRKSDDEADRKKVCGPFKREDDEEEELLELDIDEDAGYRKNVKAIQSVSPVKRETIIKSPTKSLLKSSDPDQAARIEQLKRDLQVMTAKCQKLEFEKVTSKFNYESEIKELKAEGANYREEFHKQIVTLLEQDFSCSICSEIFIQAVVLNCGHSFCEFCIAEWTKRKTDCPVCRKMVTDQIKHVEIENFLVKIHDLMAGEAKSRRNQSIQERQESQEKAKLEETRRRNNPATAADYGFAPDRFVDFIAELQHINDMFGGAHRAQFGHGGPPGIIPTDVTAQRAARNRDLLTAQLNLRRRSARMRNRGGGGGGANEGPAAAPARGGVIQMGGHANQEIVFPDVHEGSRRRGRPANRRTAIELDSEIRLQRIDQDGFGIPANRPRRLGGPTPRVITLDDSTDDADAPVQVVPEPQPGPSRLVNC